MPLRQLDSPFVEKEAKNHFLKVFPILKQVRCYPGMFPSFSHFVSSRETFYIDPKWTVWF